MELFKRIFRKTKTLDKEIRNALVAFALIISLGTFAYHFLEGWTLFDSLYFSIITLTTIGYGDVHPTLMVTKMFTMGYVLVGVGLVFYIFTSVSHHMFEDEKKDLRKIDQAIEHLEKLLEERKSS